MSSTFIRRIALAAIVTALPLSASAQVIPTQQNGPSGQPAQGAPHPHHVSPYMRALRSLNLSDAQKAQIRSIVQSYRQKNQGVDQATRRTNMRQMRSDIVGILTPDQQAQFRTQLQQMREQERKANPGPGTSGSGT